MATIQHYERHLSEQLIPGLLDIPGLKLYGITDPHRFAWRTPTVAIRLDGFTPLELANALADRGIYTWNGNFYALSLTENWGLKPVEDFCELDLPTTTRSKKCTACCTPSMR